MKDAAAEQPCVLSARNLTVGLGDRVGLEGVELAIRAGEIFGLVGPARSGKTALLETLIGLRRPLAGHVTLLGHSDPSAIEVRRHVGSSLRPSTVERRTTVQEALALCARLYNAPADLNALMQEVGLWDVRTRYRERLAPHELARLSLAMGLVSNPRVLFADEPTRELDPAGRQQVWEILRARRDRGVAVVLSTNLMDEAERLCDRVAVLGAGRILAVDSPAGLVAEGRAPNRLTMRTAMPIDAAALRRLDGIAAADVDGTSVQCVVTDTVAAVQAIGRALAEHGCGLVSLRLSQATLEDRFAELAREHAARAASANPR